jgi:hypothetical protein
MAEGGFKYVYQSEGTNQNYNIFGEVVMVAF